MSNSCVVLVLVGSPVLPECEAGLRDLERRGYEVRRVGGFANVDIGRSKVASDAMADGFDETMWIDADVGFSADDVERLRSHRLPISSAIYPKKGPRELACHVLPGTKELAFGKDGGLVEILYANGGFLHIRREVYEKVRDQLSLPICNGRFGGPFWPWFHPVLKPDGEGVWYLNEDWSFCERARQVGYRVYADTTIRLTHYGTYGYSWEDAGISQRRFDSFRLRLT